MIKAGQLVIVIGETRQTVSYVPAYYVMFNNKRVPLSSVGCLQISSSRFDIIELPLKSICLFIGANNNNRSFVLCGEQIVEVHSSWIEAI